MEMKFKTAKQLGFISQKNKHPQVYLLRPNDIQTNAQSFDYPVAV